MNIYSRKYSVFLLITTFKIISYFYSYVKKFFNNIYYIINGNFNIINTFALPTVLHPVINQMCFRISLLHKSVIHRYRISTLWLACSLQTINLFILFCGRGGRTRTYDTKFPKLRRMILNSRLL